MDFWYLCTFELHHVEIHHELLNQSLKILAQFSCMPTSLLACLTGWYWQTCSSCSSSPFFHRVTFKNVLDSLGPSTDRCRTALATFFPLQELTITSYLFPHFLFINYLSDFTNEIVLLGLGLLLILLEDLVRRLL